MSNISYQQKNVISKLTDYTKFGNISKLHLNPDHIPDLHWQLTIRANTILVDMPNPVNSVHMYTQSLQKM